jgi:hypothetical protein
MIIDCCKMTPVQSQYCMFSMIISCHFSHSNALVPDRTGVFLAALAVGTLALLFVSRR